MGDAALRAIRELFDERAAGYDQSTMHQGLAEAVAGFADLTGVQRVLDAATGTGLVLRYVDDHAPGLDLVGADISPRMLAVAAENLTNATWIEADAASLALADASIDLITCVTALHMIPDTVATVTEWARLLRPGGRVVTATFLHGRGCPGPAQHRPYPVDHEPFDSVDALAATFEPFGFVLTRHEEWHHREDSVLIAELTLGAAENSHAPRRHRS